MSLATAVASPPIILRWSLKAAEFDALCQQNRDMRFEYTSTGELIIMPPTSSDTGARNAELTTDFGIWNRRMRLGRLFDSSAGFTLPNGAKRSPDVSWISHARWQALSDEDRQGLAKICPDFVLELRSPSDNLRLLQEKMQEYLDNGARLGWLIDPGERVVYIYQPGAEVQRLDAPEELTGAPLLPGFVLPMGTVWAAAP